MLAPGTRLGHFDVIAPLGSGGMGEVYRARDRRLDRDGAIKVLKATLGQDPSRRARFAREARAVAALSHPNVLVILDVDVEHETIGTTSRVWGRQNQRYPTLAAHPAVAPRADVPALGTADVPWHTRIGEFEATPRAQPTDPPHPPVAWPHIRRNRAEGRADEDEVEGGNALNG